MEVNKFEVIIGKTFDKVEINDGNDIMTLTLPDGEAYKFYHRQDCCESVSINDVIGDIDDLVDAPILMAEEVTQDGSKENMPGLNYTPGSATWTFYKFATIKGYVTVRWYGYSNGYYSERVDFCKVGSDQDY
jgi:hypothetical protein